MGNRIDDSTSSSNVSSTQSTSVDNDASPSTDEAQSADEPQNAPYGFFTDELVRGADRQAQFEQMTTGQRPDANDGASSSGSAQDATTVLEMQAAQSASSGGVDFDEHRFANRLADDVFSNENLDFFDEYELERAFNSQVSGNLGIRNTTFMKNAELLDDRDGLEAFIADKLAARSDAPEDPAKIDEVASQLADQVEERAVRGVADRIETKARAQIDDARDTIADINADSEARRAFLGQLAEMEGDAEVLQDRLEAFGVDGSKADDIAEIVADLHDDPDALAQLARGESGPEVGFIFKEGKFDRADRLLDEALDEMDGKLERLASDALGQRAQNKHDRLLIDPNFAQARAEVFNDLDLNVDPSGGQIDGFEQVISETMEQAEHDQNVEDWMKTGLNVGIGVLSGIATGGVAAGVAGAAIQGSVDVGVSQENLELARAAEQADSGVDGVVGDATAERNAEVAKAVAGVVLAGANVGDKVSDALPERTVTGTASGIQDAIGGGVDAAVTEGVNAGIDQTTD